ncbi:MAG: 2,3-diphosphoglycerate-dependent phosphoglycerate mutase [Pseudoflavonifractor sp.]|nr:2,3-diphosphoglycerate-dependent phosphoglycerate mutase [Alloprevotella sp.]MCM1117056.1 2,3-diphosphoglycerate-dependent phosphoglycerate mutase [Pseudoflavonifractor sp.]
MTTNLKSQNTIILLRHGQSMWNLENRFTGWTDVELSDKGRDEARAAGKAMKEAGLLPKFYFTSVLRRAIHTLQIAAAEMERDYIPVIKDWHLNERHYGALQGLDKTETAAKYGDEQVHTWRRSFDVEPPILTPDDPRFPGNDPRYDLLPADRLPLTESLKDTIARVDACWSELIAPKVAETGCVLIVAHGNSLRGLAMRLLNMTADEVVNLEIPTGKPWVLVTDSRMRVTNNYYL